MTVLRAIDVEDFLHWAVARQKAHILCEKAGLWGPEAAAAGLEPEGVSGDGVASLQRLVGLGCRPDTSGLAAMLGDRCDPDAETCILVARRTFARDMPSWFLLLSYAKTGQRPSWGGHIPALDVRARTGLDMKPLILRAGGRYPYCPVEFYAREAEIASWRLFYRSWWAALARLGLALRNGEALRRHAVTGPAAPERPWERGGDRTRAAVNQSVAEPLDMRRRP